MWIEQMCWLKLNFIYIVNVHLVYHDSWFKIQDFKIVVYYFIINFHHVHMSSIQAYYNEI